MGQKQDNLETSGDFDWRVSFSGKLSQTWLWNVELNPSDIKGTWPMPSLQKWVHSQVTQVTKVTAKSLTSLSSNSNKSRIWATSYQLKLLPHVKWKQ